MRRYMRLFLCENHTVRRCPNTDCREVWNRDVNSLNLLLQNAASDPLPAKNPEKSSDPSPVPSDDPSPFPFKGLLFADEDLSPHEYIPKVYSTAFSRRPFLAGDRDLPA